MFAVSMATAQNINFVQGESGNSVAYQPTKILLDKADAEGMYYSVEPDLNVFSKVKGIMVREVNREYKESKCVKIDKTKAYGIMHAQRDGNSMHVIVSSVEKKAVIIRHVTVNLSSFTVESDKEILNREIGKKEFFYHWTACSANGNFGLVYAVVNEKDNTADVQGMLFDRSMKTIWAHSLNIGSIAQILVTDDGRIVTGGFSNGEGNTDGAALVFAIADGLGTHGGHCTSVSKVGELALLNVFGDKVLATALETSTGTGWAGTFTAGRVFTSGTIYTGCTAYLFDVAAGQVVNTDRHPFSKADARVFYNASVVSDITSPDVNFLSLRAKVTTPTGGAALYGRTWMETVTQTRNGVSTGMSSSVYYYKGMMLVKADSTGHIVWMKPLMHDNGNNGDFAENTETDLVAEGDDIYLITNESPKDGDTYDPNNAARRVVMVVHGAISAYHFSPEGSVSKQKLTADGINLIMTPLRRQAPGVYTFISGQRKGCVTEIKIAK